MQKEKVFTIYKTNIIDVYKIYDINTNIFIDILGVISLKNSRFLKNKFKNKNSLILQCEYSDYFNCWILKEK